MVYDYVIIWMKVLSYPMDENIYDFYSRGIIGVNAHGHVIKINITNY